MKRLILLVILLVPIHAFAYSCTGYYKRLIHYFILNKSEYEIRLDFDEAKYGHNPDQNVIKAAPHEVSVNAYGCSGVLTGYESRATLKASKGGSDFDLAYLYIDAAYYGAIRFSYEVHNVKSPQCRCNVHAKNRVSFEVKDTEISDCLSYNGSKKPYLEVGIICK